MHRIGLAVLMLSVGYQAAAQDAAQGKVPYERACAECHGPRGEGGEGPPIVPLQHQPQGLISITRSGKGEMAPFGRSIITDQEILLVAAYLQMLGAAK